MAAATSMQCSGSKGMQPISYPVVDVHANACRAQQCTVGPSEMLPLLATSHPVLHSFAWSITGAVGASVGGVVASRLGVSACFLVVSWANAGWSAVCLLVS